MVYQQSGEHERALTFLLQALPLAKELGSTALEGRVLAGLGTSYVMLHQGEAGCRTLEQALPLVRGNKPLEATVLGNLGSALEEQRGDAE